MTDQYGRKIKYLRLSVTDLCSCRCVYCMGAEGVPKLPHEAVLSFEEIEEIVRAAVALGVRKVRLTGGEPKEHHITDGHTSDSLRGMNRIGG